MSCPVKRLSKVALLARDGPPVGAIDPSFDCLILAGDCLIPAGDCLVMNLVMAGDCLVTCQMTVLSCKVAVLARAGPPDEAIDPPIR